MKKTLAAIIGMESASDYFKPIQKAILLKKINYSISKEGLFDFFRNKNKEESKKKTENEIEHHNDLVSANKVSIHLHTASVDDEIKFLEELISKGLPLFQKDYTRLMNCFNFIVNNHSDILSKIDKLVEIAWFDTSYNLSKEKDCLDFKTFVVSVGNNLANTKEQQAMIGGIIEWIDWDEMFPQASHDDISRYEKLYSLQEAIPVIDAILPRSRASKNQQRAYLEKDDPKLKKLLDLNIELIEKSLKINDDNKQNKMYEVAYKADKLTHPKPFGDGDENGMGNLLAHTSIYLYELNAGFKKWFINNYTAH